MMFSLFFACHHDYWQLLMFYSSLLCGFLLLIGWRVSQMKFLVWIFLVSTQNRLMIGASGGDDLIAGMFFWCLFLPIGERWSLDAALKPSPSPSAESDSLDSLAAIPKSQRHTHLSFASSALINQPGIMYLFSAFLKTGHVWYPGKHRQRTR